jgi:PBP1b-binding outer membrane lipoprotein LpoB
MKHVLVLTAALVTLAGCGGSPAPEQSASAPQTQQNAAAPKRDTVFQPLVNDLDRAKGVQKTVDDQAAEQRRQIDEVAR